ncbi:unnamed protein product, partial [Oppiella nova]
MWRGFGAETEAEPAQRGYFRPRISSISGVLAMTKQRLFTTTLPSMKDDIETAHTSAHTSPYNLAINPSVVDLGNGMILSGTRYPSPGRASFGDVMAYSRSASARPSIDSQTAHGIYGIDSSGDPLGIHDQSDTEGQDSDDKCANKTSKIFRGIALMLLIALSWVGTLYLMKISFKSEKTLIAFTTNQFNSNYTQHLNSDSNTETQQISPQSYTLEEDYEVVFDAPFLATWFCSLWNILFLPIYTISQLFCCNKEHESTKKMLIESIQGFMEKGFTLMQFFTRCGFFCVLWMITNYMLIFSLRILDITVVMAMFSTSVSIVYLLSWVVLHQKFVGIRIVAVIICDTGIALLVYMDGVQQHRTLAAVMIGFGSAIGSAIFRVFFKRMIGYTSFAQMSLFFTLIGLMNAFLMWPLILLLYLFGAEIIVWSQIPWETLTGSAILSLMANILGNFGIVWTYELFLTLGIFSAIPFCSRKKHFC